MTIEQWIKENFIDGDIKKLKKYGFTVEFEKAENESKSPYYIYITDGDEVEILRSPREIEKVVNIIKMYKGLNK